MSSPGKGRTVRKVIKPHWGWTSGHAGGQGGHRTPAGGALALFCMILTNRLSLSLFSTAHVPLTYLVIKSINKSTPQHLYPKATRA